MTIRLWNGLDDLSVVVGADFPEADEDALARCAQAWRATASDLRGLAPAASAAGQGVISALHGESGEAFAELWHRLSADDGLLGRLAAACDELAAACERAAVEVEYAKLQYIAALIVLAATLAILAAALWAGGVSALGMPLAIAAAQFTIRLVLVRLVTAVVVGVAVNVALDGLAQAIQLSFGHRAQWDLAKTRRAVEDGAIFGGTGGGVFLAGGRLAPGLLRTPLGLAGGAGLTGGLGALAAPLAHGERPSGRDLLLALSSGVAGGLAPDLAGGPASARAAGAGRTGPLEPLSLTGTDLAGHGWLAGPDLSRLAALEPGPPAVGPPAVALPAVALPAFAPPAFAPTGPARAAGTEPAAPMGPASGVLSGVELPRRTSESAGLIAAGSGHHGPADHPVGAAFLADRLAVTTSDRPSGADRFTADSPAPLPPRQMVTPGSTAMSSTAALAGPVEADRPNTVDRPAEPAATVTVDLGSDPAELGGAQFRSITDLQAVEAVRQSVFDTEAGLAFFAADDEIREFAHAVQATDGYLTLDLHGSPEGFQIDDQMLTPEQFALALRELITVGALDLPDGVGIKLLSCDTAVGGEDSPAARLARALGVEVIAPDQPVWTTLDGVEVVASPVVADGVLVPADPPDGRWHRFNLAGVELPLPFDPGEHPARPPMDRAALFLPRRDAIA